MTEIRCFISHTWNDGQHSLAIEFAKRLRQYPDLSIWIDETDIRPSQNLPSRILSGLTTETDCCIALLSPEFLQASTAPVELSLAVQLCEERGKPFFPVIVKTINGGQAPVVSRVWVDFTDTISSTMSVEDEQRFNFHILQLVEGIRDCFDVKPDLVQFLSPVTPGPVSLVTNRHYRGPFPDKASTTQRFFSQVEGALYTLKRRGLVTGWESVETDYPSNDITAILNSKVNVISYASSKINICTKEMLERIEASYPSIQLRFVSEAALRKGQLNSIFSHDEAVLKQQRAALLWNGRHLYHDNRIDHGIILRLQQSNPLRRWIIVAGCGRPASVAASQLLFDDTSKDLWSSLSSGWETRSFVIVFSVAHRREEEPSYIGRIEKLNVQYLN